MTIPNEATRRMLAIESIANELDRNQAPPKLRAQRIGAATESHLQAFRDVVAERAAPLLQRVRDAGGTDGPLQLDEHDAMRARPGSPQALIFAQQFAATQEALARMDPLQARELLASAAETGDALPFFALDNLPAVHAQRRAAIYATFAAGDLQKHRAAVRAQLNPKSAREHAELRSELQDLLGDAERGAIEIGKHDPRMRSGMVDARTWIEPHRTELRRALGII